MLTERQIFTIHYGDTEPHIIHGSYGPQVIYQKRHFDRFSRFSTAHSCDKQTYTETTEHWCLLAMQTDYIYLQVCLQCFDAVGWAAGRASGL